MFEGSGFGIPALFVTVLTVTGGLCVLAGWGIVLLDQSKVPPKKVPYALYTFTLSVLVQLTGPLVLWHLPYELAQRPIFGMRMVLFIWSFFLATSFALIVFSWLLVRRASGPATWLLRRGSMLLLTVWVLGFIWYVAGE
jgi:hypothetical protein